MQRRARNTVEDKSHDTQISSQPKTSITLWCANKGKLILYYRCAFGLVSTVWERRYNCKPKCHAASAAGRWSPAAVMVVRRAGRRCGGEESWSQVWTQMKLSTAVVKLDLYWRTVCGLRANLFARNSIFQAPNWTLSYVNAFVSCKNFCPRYIVTQKYLRFFMK